MSNAPTVELSSSILNGTNKKGVIRKDSNGEYQIVVGGLNMCNNKGEYYEYKYAEKFFRETSELTRMARKNVLRGEYGHPNQAPGQKDDDFVRRLLRIDEQSVCCSHRRLRLDFDNYRDGMGRPIIAIVSHLAPYGPFADPLERAIEDGKEEVCFSIRCFSLPFKVGGRVIKEIKHIVTFDYVNEPGIAMATKYHSASLESHTSLIELPEARTFTQGTVIEAAQQLRRMPGSNESARLPMDSFLASMGWEVRDTPGAKRNFLELMNSR